MLINQKIRALLDGGLTPLFDSRLKANRVEYLLARDTGIYLASGGLGPVSVTPWLAGRMADQIGLVLLSERQAQQVWQQEIEASRWAADLLDLRRVARWAREAAGLAGEFDVPLQRLRQDPALEAQAVAVWAAAVGDRLQQEGWLDPRKAMAGAAANSDSLGLERCVWLDRQATSPAARRLANADGPGGGRAPPATCRRGSACHLYGPC